MAVSGVASVKAVAKAFPLPSEDVIFGRSAAMQPIRQMVGKILTTDLPVLIQGENGTGKGLLAQYIHSRSKFASGACVKVNCAAIPGSLLESELFGYEKGAFTDAQTSKPGYVEMANNGTLFLDEISDLDPSLQAKTLQLLQDGQYSRIGDTQERHVHTRVICATNRKLEDEITAGRFRQDLFYRINVVTLNLPSLRERREDIPELASYFLKHLNARFERDAPPFPEDVIATFIHNEWRGNIRELENVVARYAILGAIDEDFAGTTLKRPANPLKLSVDGTVSLKHIAKQAVREMESSVILRVLRENKWNRRKAANVLNISYRALIYKIQEAGLAHRHNRKNPNPVSAKPSPPAMSAEGIDLA
jgi:two-component system, NtrC family, response regulator AtoC